MAWSSSLCFKRTIAALALSSFIASAVSAMTLPATRAHEVLVNRTHKGDRLTQVPAAPKPLTNPVLIDEAPALKRPPLGCDAAFSPVADPGRGHIFKRCMA
jgi:hypothetical protein